MAIGTSNAYSGPYLGNGSTTAFPFTFSVLTSDQVSVQVDGADVPSSEYSVSLSGPAPSIGTVTFGTAPASGATIYTYLDPEFSQDIEFSDGAAWIAKPVNDGYDQSVLRDQALKRDIGRSLRLPIGDSVQVLPGSEDLKGKYLAFDAEGNPIAVDGTGNCPAFRLAEIDLRDYIGFDFDGEGGTLYTTELQKAINDAAAENAYLIFPSNAILKSGKIVLPGGGVFWKTRGGRCRLRLADGADDDLVFGQNVSGASFERIDFDGNRANNSRNADLVSNNGLHILKGSSISTIECTFTECVENGARLIGIDGYYSARSTFSANSHNGRFCSGHIDGTAFQSFTSISDFAYDNATDGLNFEENCHDGLVLFPRATNNGADQSTYVGGTGILFYGGETTYQPHDITVYGARTIGNYGGGVYVVSGSDITVVNPSSLNDGATGVSGETDFGNSFAAYCNGAGAHGASQSISNVRFINPVSRGAGKAGFYGYSATSSITGLRLESPDFSNPSSLVSNTFDAIWLNNCTAPVILDPVIADARGTKLMRNAIKLQSGVSSARVRWNKDEVGTGLTGVFADASSSPRPECSWTFSLSYTMPTIAANTDYFAAGQTLSGLKANDVISITFNQAGNALSVDAHPSAADTFVLTVRNRGGGSFASFAGTLRGTVIKTDFS